MLLKSVNPSINHISCLQNFAEFGTKVAYSFCCHYVVTHLSSEEAHFYLTFSFFLKLFYHALLIWS